MLDDINFYPGPAAETKYAAIYINGDTTLDDPHKKVLLIAHD